MKGEQFRSDVDALLGREPAPGTTYIKDTHVGAMVVMAFAAGVVAGLCLARLPAGARAGATTCVTAHLSREP